MLEQLQQIDTSVIDELMEIKQEKETIAERLAKMSEDQGKVSDVVYRRVRRDYEARQSALERKAAPLKDRARQEYAKLKALLDRIEGVHSATKLDREEIDFRHKLGEYTDDEFKKKSGELDDKIDEQKSSLEEIEAVREQFLGAVDSEQELTLPTPAAPPAPATPPPAAPAPPAPAIPDNGITAPQPVTPIGLTAAGILAPPPPPPAAPAPEPPPPPAKPAPVAGAEPDGTVILPPEAPAPAAASTAAPPPPAAAPTPIGAETSPSAAGGRTVVLAKGKLIAIDTDLGATEFPLEPLTFIGRTPENQIRLNKPAVSRRHAQIAQSDSGYVLRDLNSENGTYVNGERVKEKALANGDRVQIGTVRFVFRAE